jgi:hypothetical protein
MSCIAFGSFISECQLRLVAMLDTAGRVTKNRPQPIFGEMINEDEVIKGRIRDLDNLLFSLGGGLRSTQL